MVHKRPPNHLKNVPKSAEKGKRTSLSDDNLYAHSINGIIA